MAKVGGKTGMYWREVHRGDKTYVQRFRAKKSTGVAGRVAKPKPTARPAKATAKRAPRTAGVLPPRRVAALEKKAKSIEGRIAKVDARAAAARDRIASRIDKNTAKLSTQIHALRKRAMGGDSDRAIKPLMSKIKRLEARRDSFGDRLSKRGEKAEARVQKVRDRLNKRLGAVREKLDAHRVASGGAPGAKRTKAAKTTATHASPSAAIKADPAIRRPAQQGIAGIAKVHRLPNPPPAISVTAPLVEQSGIRASYFFGTGSGFGANVYSPRGGKPATRRIELSRTGGDAFGFVHEFGHHLDHTFFGSAGTGSKACGSARASSPEMRELMTAISRSKAHANLTNMKRHGFAHEKRGAAYMLEPHELFARAYSQYVAQRSKDRRLISGLDERLSSRNTVAQHAQWQGSDFKPIAMAFDRLFAAHGLSR